MTRAATPSTPSRAMRILAAAVVSAACLLTAAHTAWAAEGGLVIVATTNYEVLPAERRVHVRLDAVATSLEPDTPEGQVFYSGATFAVPAAASNIQAFSGNLRLQTRIVEEADAFRAVEVTFGRGVFFRQSYPYTVTFDMVDPGGEGNRDLRIGTSLVAFPVWAFGSADEPGGSVRVELPAGYTPQVQGSEMARTRDPAGRSILTARPADPLAFFAYVSADRPGAYVDIPVEVVTQRARPEVVVRAWDDDPEWGGRMATLMADGIPALENLIGVPYPHTGRLRVEEAAISRLGQYAGLYDRAAGVIQVRYDADAYVALHEAAHVWFNDRLFPDRWIGEAWAEFYAVEAGEALGTTGFTWELTPQLLESRVPLNDWGAVGREALEVEDFAYAASYHLAGSIAERVTLDQLRVVWQAAAAREPAYLPGDGQKDGEAAPLPGQPGWQRLLDLLEERTDATVADLWAEWVVNADEQRQLALRAHARSRHDGLRDNAAGWELPAGIRSDLGSWRFDEAVEALAVAERILDRWERVTAAARQMDLEPSDRVRTAFESGDELDEASTLVDLEVTVLASLERAESQLSRQPRMIEIIGLWGEDPTVLLDRARWAYEAGQLGASERGAQDAIEARSAAAAEGTGRAVLGAAALIGADGFLLLILSGLRLRRRPASLRSA